MLHKNYTPEASKPLKESQEEQPEKQEQTSAGNQSALPEDGLDRPEQGPAIPPQEQTKGIP